jgi:hypothetical protein
MNVLYKKKSSPLTKCSSKNQILSPRKISDNIEQRQMTPKLENRKIGQKSEEEYIDLVSNPLDDIKTLIKKNAKLRSILVKTTTSLNEIVTIH